MSMNIQAAVTAGDASEASAPLLVGRDLVKRYGRRARARDDAAVRGVTLSVHKGVSLGLVGESGSGKTTVGLMLAALLAPSEGTVELGGRQISGPDKVVIGPKDRRLIQVVFQDSFGSLNPRVRALDTIARTLEGTDEPRRARLERSRELLLSVGLPRSRHSNFPHELSGGERQRVNIARAVALHPTVIVADEPVSSLDVSIQAKILTLLRELRRRLGTSYVFISHDLAVTQYITDIIAVMYAGRIVEQASARSIVEQPLHPYTQRLVASARGGGAQLATAPVELVRSQSPGSQRGCDYHNQCPLAADTCFEHSPELLSFVDGHDVACFRAGLLADGAESDS
jgi:oligopeptide/dipeptide ABC transporter ATP-binding protein